MEKFLRNWTYTKHALATSGFYLSTAVLVNSVLSRTASVKEDTRNPIAVYANMPKKQKVFNGILATCYVVDMSATYLILNHFRKRIAKR